MAAWQILVCLTVLSFLCRAFIPLGYMPDSSSERASPFALTLCSSNGLRVVHVAHPSVPDPAHHEGLFNGEHCPFGLTAAHTLMPGPDAPALSVKVVFFPLRVPALRQPQHLAPVAGPPLGQRAPPALTA